MSELFLFVRPPRPLWPFNGPSTAFWPPLAFASLAAALRSALPKLSVAILDAPAQKMGWASLTSELNRLKPKYVAIGEEATGCVETLRVATLAKNSGATLIAGGCFFAHISSPALESGLVDIVVHGEGEQTLPELVDALQNDGTRALNLVRGISFRDGERITRTHPRPLIDDLDKLPFPAYDLLPVEKYGQKSRNHNSLAAIELSRGCTQKCKFCILWRQMGRFAGSELRPCLRTKSAERVFEEICILNDRFGRHYLGWVDPCFNADPKIPAQVSELLLRSGRHLGQSAWVRADYLLRDLRSGAFGKCARAGLNEIYLGIERSEESDFETLGKTGTDVRPALELLSIQHPDIFKVGSFIYGLPGDTPRRLRSLYQYSYSLPLDLNFFIPLTPLPGTAFWDASRWDGSWQSFRNCDFLPHATGDHQLARLSSQLYWMWMFMWPWKRLCREFASKFAQEPRRRSISWRVWVRNFRFVLTGLVGDLLDTNECFGMRYPTWYFD